MNRAHPIHAAIRVLKRVGWTALIALLVITTADILSATASTPNDAAKEVQANDSNKKSTASAPTKGSLSLKELRDNAPETPLSTRLTSLLGIVVLSLIHI